MTLRVRLVAATVVVSVLALGGAGVATHSVFTRFQVTQVDARLRTTGDQIEATLGHGVVESDLARAAAGAFVQLADRDGAPTLTIVPQRRGDDEPPVPDPESLREVVAGLRGQRRLIVYRNVPVADGGGDLRLRVALLDDGVLVIGESLHEQAEAASRLVRIESVVALVAAVVAGILGVVLVRVGLAPLRRTERTALAIANSGDVSLEAVGASTATEAGRLALALNTMLARIRAAFAERDATEQALRDSEQRMRRFVADVSHELRTPLAAVSAYTELIDRGARSNAEDLDRALAGIASETRRMGALVEELLLLARLDQHQPTARVEVDLSEILLASVATARAVDSTYPIELRISDVVTVEGDPDQLSRVFDNLLSNVRTHTPLGTQARVDLIVEGDRAVLVVSNDGPRQTTEHVDRAFERFYRGDPSRSRSSGGSGLGLAIVDAIVTAHGGTAVIEAVDGGWTVRITLPRIGGSSDRTLGAGG